MTRVEFYVLSSTSSADRLRAACQLASKAWRHGMPVFLRCADEAQCAEVDELLWRFKAETFVPHSLYRDDPLAPVVLGLNDEPAAQQGLLINLDPSLSPFIERFSRVIEIVNQEPEQLHSSRENFRTYRQRGYDPQRVEL
ncbi:DNA polymerase III subunit chi [Pseudomonas cavernicola]|uniref:DNA polymerase III subunit chi n=1 Tax=Pseudomonas cavernicola TaxID=2320866 RepID=A0A418XCN9_9PSED|nr:DNA polymerase III subunit chi [Pseudomonas cavernicola]RJG10305.1 DNA polymerase III subunit chi [Pseudomonas cavernicola]